MKIALLAGIFTFIVSIVNAQGIALTTGVLDYSDHKKRSEFFEVNYSFSEDKSLETIIGKIVPMTGAMLTKDNASMIYAGIKTEYKIGNFFISPSFAPGYYNEGDGKDLGHDIEFKTQLNFGWNLGDKSNFGLSYSHISNADLGVKNPGANNIAFTFFRQY